MVLCLAWLSGCAATSVTSQVQSFGTWPATRKPSTFVFDVLPSQQAQDGQAASPARVTQATLQAAALPALNAIGFTQLPPSEQAERADVLVQLALQVRVDSSLRYEPIVPYGFNDPFSPFGSYGPYPRRGGRWHRSIWGPGWMPMSPPWVTVQVDVILRDRQTSQVLYETHAAHDSPGAVDETALPYLFEAALQGFPNAPPGARVVDIPLPPSEAR